MVAETGELLCVWNQTWATQWAQEYWSGNNTENLPKDYVHYFDVFFAQQ